MAGIDKTYINKFEDYKSAIDWCKSVGTIVDDYGNKITPLNYVYYPDITKEEWDSWVKEYLQHPEHKKDDFELVLWNTPTPFDIWLIRNCPLDFIQNRLKQQYGGGWSKEAFTDHNSDDMYDQIKNRTSIYDTYTRGNKTTKNLKLRIKTIFGSSIRDKKCWWWISVHNTDSFSPMWWYDSTNNKWFNTNEAYLGESYSSVCDNINCPLTKKNIINLIRKWNLPKGTYVTLECSMKQYMYWKIKVEY